MFFRDDPLVAIDIGSSGMRMVQMSAGKVVQPLAVGSVRVPRDTFTREGLCHDELIFREVLKELLQKSGVSFQQRKVAVALGPHAVKMQRVDLDLSGDLTLREQVEYFAEQHFADSCKELQVSFAPLVQPKRHAPSVPAIVIGARRDVLAHQREIFGSIGMQVGIVDASAICLTNCLEALGVPRSGSIAVLNMGMFGTEIAFLEDGILMGVFPIRVCGDDYTQIVAAHLGVSAEQAESAKLMISAGQRPTSPKLLQAIEQLHDQVSDQVESAIAAWWSRARGQRAPVSSVMMTGGAVMMAGLKRVLHANLSVRVDHFNPFHHMALEKSKYDQRFLHNSGHAFAVAFGLALRRGHDWE
jgi:type IV pilus assembly protein PilM